jgi:ATP synthase protein I
MTDPDPPVKEAPHVASVLKLAAAMQRTAAILSMIVAVVAIVVAWLLRGAPGAIGAVVGSVIAIGLGWLGTFVMAKTARATPAGVMIGAMTAFTGKIAFLLVFLLLFRGTTLFDNRAFAFTMLAVTAAWILGEVIGFVRTRIPVVDL